jgi:imidazolonepropionase-like amidohydrolase
MRLRRSLALLLVFAAPLLEAAAPGVYAITGGTVHPVSGAPIANGTVIVRNGLIEAVGANVPVPADATTIDATGSHVYPGLIDAHTSAGFAAAKEKDAADPNADSLAIRNVKLTDDEVDARRRTGVTTIVTAPSRGIFNGQSVVLNLSSGTAESRVLKSPAAQQISFAPRPTWTYPDSLMGVIAHLRQTFFDAQQHATAREIYERQPAGLRRPVESPALDALRPAMRRELPVVFVADSAAMIRRAQSIAREFNLRLVVAGARDAHSMTSELRDVPVLVSVRWPVAPADKDDRAEQPLRVIRERQLAPTTPAALRRAGVQFALVSGSGKAGDFLPGIRKAIREGLSAEDALQATTLAPARIFGVDRQLGTLERGKIANLVITDLPLFDEKSKVKTVLVDGREIRLPADEKAAPKEAATPIDGTWAISVRAPQGSVSMQVTLRAEDGKLSGTFSGDRGSGDIRGGTFEGTTFEFTISANAQNEAEASDWVFSGTVDGNAIRGSVATTLGNFEFSGSKSE